MHSFFVLFLPSISLSFASLSLSLASLSTLVPSWINFYARDGNAGGCTRESALSSRDPLPPALAAAADPDSESARSAESLTSDSRLRLRRSRNELQ